MAQLLNKSRKEVEELLSRQEVIELDLSERKTKQEFEDDDLKICE